MNAYLSRLAICCTLALTLAACAGLKSPSAERRSTALDVATETYRKLVRWGYFEQAAEYLRAKEGEIARPDFQSFARYKVTGYHPGELLINETGDEARVVTVIEFYEIDTGVARSLRDPQYWWFDSTEKRWYLGSPMPDFDVAAQSRTVRLSR